MTDQETPDAGIDHAFLRDLPERHQTRLACGARVFNAAPRELLARQGETANTFYLIRSGYVSIGLHTPDRGIVPIQTVGPGEVVGWSWRVPPYRWQFDCRAVDSVQGLALDAEYLRQQCEQDHELGYYLLKQLVAVMGDRLAATRLQLLDIYK
jgi:CRP-like cAMP-binding protein